MLNWKGLVRSHILERGWDYASDGSFTDFVKTDDSISAVVQGSEYYKVKIEPWCLVTAHTPFVYNRI